MSQTHHDVSIKPKKEEIGREREGEGFDDHDVTYKPLQTNHGDRWLLTCVARASVTLFHLSSPTSISMQFSRHSNDDASSRPNRFSAVARSKITESNSRKTDSVSSKSVTTAKQQN